MWLVDGCTGVNYIDDNGFFEILFNILVVDLLGDFSF
jgi:hypothetical protein